MKRLIFSTGDGWAGLVLRITAAVVMFPHGAQKLLGWFGGFGFAGVMSYFTETMHLPWIIGFLVIIIEFFAPIALLLGFATRISALLLSFVVLGIIFTTAGQHGFFMNWYGTNAGEGYEFFLLFLGLLIGLVIVGGSKYSVDRLLDKKIAE
jgi:putative oxidoreductase